MTPAAIVGPAAGVLAAAGGVGLLRLGWRAQRPAPPSLVGWLLIASAARAWTAAGAWDKAIALALLYPSLAGLGFVVANAEIRAPRRRKPPRAATELPDRSGEAVWRGVARALCAGPLAGAAAFLLAAAWALKGAGSEADRFGAALMLAPALWAVGLIWATTDGKLARIAGGLGALALCGGAAAAL